MTHTKIKEWEKQEQNDSFSRSSGAWIKPFLSKEIITDLAKWYAVKGHYLKDLELDEIANRIYNLLKTYEP